MSKGRRSFYRVLDVYYLDYKIEALRQSVKLMKIDFQTTTMFPISYLDKKGEAIPCP